MQLGMNFSLVFQVTYPRILVPTQFKTAEKARAETSSLESEDEWPEEVVLEKKASGDVGQPRIVVKTNRPPQNTVDALAASRLGNRCDSYWAMYIVLDFEIETATARLTFF